MHIVFEIGKDNHFISFHTHVIGVSFGSFLHKMTFFVYFCHIFA